MKEKGNRIKGMDGLRGIAIIGITLFHMFPNVFKGGYLGVVLFFVLTGFLMVITNKKKMENREFSAIKFYISRIDTFNKLGYKAKINTHTTSYIN